MSDRQSRDSVPGIELVEQLSRLNNELPQGMGSERDFAMRSSRPQKNEAAPDFKARRFFSEIAMLVHTPDSPRSNAEQRGIEAQSKPLNQPVTGANHLFRQTAFGALPAAPRAAACLPINRRPEFSGASA